MSLCSNVCGYIYQTTVERSGHFFGSRNISKRGLAKPIMHTEGDQSVELLQLRMRAVNNGTGRLSCVWKTCLNLLTRLTTRSRK